MRRGLVLAAVAAALIAGFWLGRGPGGGGQSAPGAAGHDHGAQEAMVWTCAMHPQIRLPEPGQCPICFMDLIPVEGGQEENGDAPRLEMSKAARTLAEIETRPVVRERPFVEVRLVGKVEYDETRVGALTAWVPGRLDRLYVDYTGIRVRQGDHLAEIYSPELLSAQEELVQAIAARDRTSAEASPRLRGSAEATVEAVREKLRLLGLTAAQLDALERGGDPGDHVTLYAKTGGVVIAKNAVEGDYVQTGAVIYRIADLSRVWVQLDAYESDLAWLRYGQDVEFAAEAVPGRTFHGRISFLSPTLDPETRTVKVRVNVENQEGLLKPEMFVRATVLAETGGGGVVVAADLAGKWICPMHPEIVKEGRGACDLCGMDLVPPEELGWSAPEGDEEAPLVIPRSAVLLTGKRAIVYVEVPGAARPTYEGREVVLGPRAGELYLVREGLAEGERVVVQGNFKIDSALQIQAKPSMMSPPGKSGGAPAGHAGHAGAAPARVPEEFRSALSPLYAAYFELGGALAADDPIRSGAAVQAVHHALHAVEESPLDARARSTWRRLAGELGTALEAAPQDTDLAALRTAFEPVSQTVIGIRRAFGHDGEEPFFVTYCPMAFDSRGASWMQDHEGIDNPYFGARMLRCGEVREELAP